MNSSGSSKNKKHEGSTTSGKKYRSMNDRKKAKNKQKDRRRRNCTTNDDGDDDAFLLQQFQKENSLSYYANTCSRVLRMVIVPCGIAMMVAYYMMMMQQQDNDAVVVEYFHMNDECGMFMAKSTLGESTGYGMFVGRNAIRAHTPIGSADSVIHLTDMVSEIGIQTLLHDYSWTGKVVGGHHIAQTVMAVSPGINMLSNGDVQQQNNVIPYKALLPNMENESSSSHQRSSSIMAGASTHYHSFQQIAAIDMNPGTELFVNYGTGWTHNINSTTTTTPNSRRRSLPYLQKHGACVDHIVPGDTKFDRGPRGAFARRDLLQHSIVAPVPVLPILKDVLQMSHKQEQTYQLLLNYCFGHVNSSVLLFPYGPSIHLLNHHATSSNVKIIMMAPSTNDELSNVIDLEDEQPSFLQYQLVATKDIRQGDELLLDYGVEWQHAYTKQQQQQQTSNDEYVYKQNYNLPQQLPTTTEEEAINVLPSNLQYAVYVPPAIDSDISSRQQSGVAYQYPINFEQQYHDSQLVACTIVNRSDDEYYVVQATVVVVVNDTASTTKQQQQQTVNVQLVQVPRSAISVVDRPYTTDQHLSYAFRHWIGNVPFPEEWLE